MAADIRTEQQKVTDATKKLAALKLIRQPHEALINEAIEFTYPGRMTINDTTKGQKKGATIYDTDATIACNLFGDGMHGYLFSPGWLKLRLPNTIEFGRATGMRRWSGKRADEIPEVAEWLVDSQDVMHGAFTRSNFYSVTPQVFKDWGCIGNVGVYGENDLNNGKICFTVPHIRELYISRDRYGGIDGVFRVYNSSLSNLVEKFGRETLRTKGGMMHKDDPVEGFEVKEKCPLFNNGCTVNHDSSDCPGPCHSSRPLTLGELPERGRKMRGALEDLILLAKEAMKEANNDGAEYDIEGELRDANDALKEGQDEQ